MNILKRIPIKYHGELHDIRLINFTVDIDEVKELVPHQIRIRDFDGRAMISMVDVKLKNMRPAFAPKFCTFSYRHIAFRLLVEDEHLNAGSNKGIFFCKAFTNNPIMVIGGKALTEYRLENARIMENGDTVKVNNGKHKVEYTLSNKLCESTFFENQELRKMIGAIDRAYSTLDNNVRVTQIQREKWPIQQVECSSFSTNFFKSAKFIGAFRVFETIYYQWLPPKSI
ncbi:DUF2071 domain-containing protein [Solitalea sp. MAHUQ-68]|uniref:DUF2071 domain-containing protein n=1 Tax=Solitalea agri TaxID=2953739 RepID=A0A9X2F291_9SPHI|nr:DUF2071 domain-containing protein [Solitalea agri]MCO4292775.1 DUF2071 domain-containing protein [Solitalea agri]